MLLNKSAIYCIENGSSDVQPHFSKIINNADDGDVAKEGGDDDDVEYITQLIMYSSSISV